MANPRKEEGAIKRFLWKVNDRIVGSAGVSRTVTPQVNIFLEERSLRSELKDAASITVRLAAHRTAIVRTGEDSTETIFQ